MHKFGGRNGKFLRNKIIVFVGRKLFAYPGGRDPGDVKCAAAILCGLRPLLWKEDGGKR